MNILAWLALALALLGIGAGGGVAWQARHQSADLAVKSSDLQTCKDNASVQEIAIGNFQQRAIDDKAQLDALRALANTALGQRDTLAQKLSEKIGTRVSAVKKVTHETPDCQSLATLPVCPVVGDRLWGSAVAGDDTPPAY